jgi:tetratricopeptide (TPR) repeat protein
MRLLKNLFARRNCPEADASTRPPSKPKRDFVVVESGPTMVARARAAATEGKYGDALQIVDDALTNDINDFDLLFARATILFSWGRYREGRDALILLADRGQSSGPFCMKLGWACFWAGDLTESEQWMRKCVSIQPDDWEAQFALGTCLHAIKKTEEGRAAFLRALDLKPNDPYCIANLSVCEVELGRLDVADGLSRNAVELDPSSAIAWSNLGVVLEQKDCYGEAIAAFEKAEESCAASGKQEYDYVNFAVCLLHAGLTERGVQFLANKLARYPSAQAHSHYALSLLLLGRFDEGWDQYEFRWLDGPLKSSRQDFPVPWWGGQDLAGKMVLLRSEQGYGDFIQFIRFAPHLKSKGATVLLQLPEALRKLASNLAGIDRILLPDQPYPAFDFFVNLLSLPRLLREDIERAGSTVPYLSPDDSLSLEWKNRLNESNKIKVGLVWAGSPTHLRDKYRSVQLNKLVPLIGASPNFRFYSLQKGPATEELANLPQGVAVADLSEEINDFVDTAAAISQMDLVICVDTAVAHLAGALGKPVWLMLSKPNDWRWLEDRDDSPWYPTMRLFRQRDVAEWDHVVCRIADALSNFKPDGAIASGAASNRSSIGINRPIISDHRKTPKPMVSAATYTRIGMLQYWRDEFPAGESIAYYGEYLQPQLNLLCRLIPRGATVVEVGSGVGIHAVFLGKLIGPEGHLMLVELAPKMAPVLRQNLSANGVTGVTLVRDQDGGNEATIDQLRLQRLQCLKIHQHNQPVQVLQGSVDTLWRLRPIVFASANNARDMAMMADLARGCSYRTWQMDTSLFATDNFNRRTDDVFDGRCVTALFAAPEEIEMDITLANCVELLGNAKAADRP